MSDREHIEEFLMRLCSEFGTTDTPITEEIEAEIILQETHKSAFDELDKSNHAMAETIITFLQKLHASNPSDSADCEKKGLQIIRTKMFRKKK